MAISLGCQYGSLMEGNVNQRLQSREDRLLLLDFLLSELEAARMVSNIGYRVIDLFLSKWITKPFTEADVFNIIL